MAARVNLKRPRTEAPYELTHISTLPLVSQPPLKIGRLP
jgi:hypothetical protein